MIRSVPSLPGGTRLVKAVLASAPRGKQFWPKGWRAVPNEGSPCCGKQWSKTAPWLGSSHFENGWRGGSARIKRELLGRGGRAPKDTVASSSVKAGINCTDSHRFSLNPASFLLGSHISPVLLPYIPTPTCLAPACQTRGPHASCIWPLLDSGIMYRAAV